MEKDITIHDFKPPTSGIFAAPSPAPAAAPAPATLPPPDLAAPIDDRPVMTEKELSFHTTLAAIEARKVAGSLDSSADARHVVVAAAAAEHGGGLLDIDGIMSGPVSLGVLWAMELAEKPLKQLEDSRCGDQAVMAWVLTHPREALTAAIEGRFVAFAEGAIELALSGRISAAQGQALEEWYVAEVRRITHVSGAGDDLGTAAAPGKSSAASRT